MAYHSGEARRVRRYMVARRHDSRFLLDEAEQAEVAASREADPTLAHVTGTGSA